jgi:site-specific recombinase XerC
MLPFATVACAAERDLMAVQQLLGPAKPGDTAVYARVADGSLLTAVRATSGCRP